LPWLILLRYWSKLGYIFVRSWVQAAQKKSNQEPQIMVG